MDAVGDGGDRRGPRMPRRPATTTGVPTLTAGAGSVSSDRPAISVVIPTYNCAHMLADAIRSAYAQTLPPVEVVVVNDGSTDDTAQLLDGISKNLPSSFVYETKANGGEASARNRGVELSRGEFVAFLDQDDRWLPSKLE